MTGEKSSKIRLFVAIDLPEEEKRRLKKILAELKKELGGIKWVDPDNIHLTLKFLGDVSIGKVPLLRSALDQAVFPVKPFSMKTGDLGIFPKTGRPRVLWLGLEKGGNELSDLRERLEKFLSPLGFPPEKRKFTPHLTLGRIKSRSGAISATNFLRETSEGRFGLERLGPMNITMLLLIKSVLSPRGAIHEIISKHRLKGGLEPSKSKLSASRQCIKGGNDGQQKTDCR